MHWLIGENLYSERNFKLLTTILEKLNAKYDVVKIVPFSHELVPEPDVTDNDTVIGMGCTTLGYVCEKRNWKPGFFSSENFNYKKMKIGYGINLLNYYCNIDTLDNIKPLTNEFFIKPYDDSKLFIGTVLNKKYFYSWRYNLLYHSYNQAGSTIDENTIVIISKIKELVKEFRFFIIDNKVITSSTYKIGKNLNTSIPVDQKAIEFVERMINRWEPCIAYVMDVCLLKSGEYKVIELNTLNCSGFYSCDVDKIVYAINGLYK